MNRLEKSEKMTQNTGKLIMLFFSDSQISGVLFVKMDTVFSYKNKNLKNTGKMEKK